MKAGIYDDRLFVPYKHGGGGRWFTATPDYRYQVFSFLPAAQTRTLHFDVARLIELILEGKPPFDRVEAVICPIEAAGVAHVIEHHGVEEAGIARLTPERLEKPALLCKMADGSTVMVDGNHRYVANFRRGRTEMRFWLLRRDQWRLCLLDIPEAVGRQMATGWQAPTTEGQDR